MRRAKAPTTSVATRDRRLSRMVRSAKTAHHNGITICGTDLSEDLRSCKIAGIGITVRALDTAQASPSLVGINCFWLSAPLVQLRTRCSSCWCAGQRRRPSSKNGRPVHNPPYFTMARACQDRTGSRVAAQRRKEEAVQRGRQQAKQCSSTGRETCSASGTLHGCYMGLSGCMPIP